MSASLWKTSLHQKHSGLKLPYDQILYSKTKAVSLELNFPGFFNNSSGRAEATRVLPRSFALVNQIFRISKEAGLDLDGSLLRIQIVVQ